MCAVPADPTTTTTTTTTGPHNGGGGGTFASTFVSSFGYVDTLGTLARLNHSVLARQTLVGGNYELLRCSSGQDAGPEPGTGCDFGFRATSPGYWVLGGTAVEEGDGDEGPSCAQLHPAISL